MNETPKSERKILTDKYIALEKMLPNVTIIKSQAIEKEMKAILKQLGVLPFDIEVIEEGNLEFETIVVYKSNLCSIKKSPKGIWFVVPEPTFGGGYVAYKVITDDANKPIKVEKTITSSETLGITKTYAYTIKFIGEPIAEIEPKLPNPCARTKGFGIVLFDGNRYGMVWDCLYKQWRQPTTQEYDAKLKLEKEAKTTKQKKKKVVFTKTKK